MQHPDCLACQILSGQVEVPGGTIAENEWWIADHCVGAYGLGAIVVKSRQHRENLWDLTSDESASLGSFMQQISQAMAVALEAERVYVSLWVDQPPYHVHFVLQPRYSGKAELGLKGLELQVYRSLHKPPKATEMAEVAAKLKAYLQTQGLTGQCVS
ncbi:MAG TPA: HIT family protein [Trichocoleus sp.]